MGGGYIHIFFVLNALQTFFHGSNIPLQQSSCCWQEFPFISLSVSFVTRTRKASFQHLFCSVQKCGESGTKRFHSRRISEHDASLRRYQGRKVGTKWREMSKHSFNINYHKPLPKLCTFRVLLHKQPLELPWQPTVNPSVFTLLFSFPFFLFLN